MTAKKIVKMIGFIEVAIGMATLIGSTALTSNKSPNVFLFVFISAAASSAIGIGILNHRHWARILLVFFSGYIILTKILIFTGLLYFNGEIITFIPTASKNCVSITYHAFIIIFFTRQKVSGFFMV